MELPGLNAACSVVGGGLFASETVSCSHELDMRIENTLSKLLNNGVYARCANQRGIFCSKYSQNRIDIIVEYIIDRIIR